MQAFAMLHSTLDETTGTNEKVAAMASYFENARPEDAAWAVYLLSGRRPKRVISSTDLREWGGHVADVPRWLFEESCSVVGDLAETIALLLPDGKEGSDRSLQYWIERRLLPLQRLGMAAQRKAMVKAWSELNHVQRFLWNKLVAGSFRAGVSHKLLVRALSRTSGIDETVLAHRMMGDWNPSADTYRRLVSKDTADADKSRPYPFCLAHPVEGDPMNLGDLDDWQVEWTWNGIRAQVVRRGGRAFIWSRSDELVTERYPEVRDSLLVLPDGVVLDGELLAWRNGSLLPFGHLQRRMGRKTVSRKVLREIPVRFLAFDILERDGKDLRELPLLDRRAQLLDVLAHTTDALQIRAAPLVDASSWDALATLHIESRDRRVEGVILKRLDSRYAEGRTDAWWKWKVDPYSINAVLLYAQHGERATLFTDYTFAVWDGDDLVPFAKTRSGLTDAEIRDVDTFVRENTVDRFGPVRAVEPHLVFEIGFEGIWRSSRHKSGVTVRSPRVLIRRSDKNPKEADTIQTLRSLLPDVDESG